MTGDGVVGNQWKPRCCGISCSDRQDITLGGRGGVGGRGAGGECSPSDRELSALSVCVLLVL